MRLVAGTRTSEHARHTGSKALQLDHGRMIPTVGVFHLPIFGFVPLAGHVVVDVPEELGHLGSAGPEEFLRGYRGHLQADAYGGYDAFFKDPARAGGSRVMHTVLL